MIEQSLSKAQKRELAERIRENKFQLNGYELDQDGNKIPIVYTYEELIDQVRNLEQ